MIKKIINDGIVFTQWKEMQNLHFVVSNEFDSGTAIAILPA